MRPAARLRRQWVLLGLALLAAAPLMVLLSARSLDLLGSDNTDFYTFWLAARMNWTGQNPYAAADWLAASRADHVPWIPNPIFPYPLPLATLLAPVGLF